MGGIVIYHLFAYHAAFALLFAYHAAFMLLFAYHTVVVLVATEQLEVVGQGCRRARRYRRRPRASMRTLPSWPRPPPHRLPPPRRLPPLPHGCGEAKAAALEWYSPKEEDDDEGFMANRRCEVGAGRWRT